VTERRLFEDGRFHTPDTRARFCYESPRPAPESVDDDYPMILLTGRGTSAQWHTQTRTDKSSVLRKLYPADPYVEINPRDAHDLGILPRDRVRVTSRRGDLIARALVTSIVQPGQVFMPMHYAETNRLTLAVFDPYSRQPGYKACSVRVDALGHRAAAHSAGGTTRGPASYS
jgi:assimilatory nitrate reductase catalytic subunit